MATVKIESTDPKSQGPFVIIDEVDFDPKLHKKYSEKGESKPQKKVEQQ